MRKPTIKQGSDNPNALSLDDKRDLSDYFDGSLACSMGIRSALGPQLARLELGLGQSSSAQCEPSQRQCEAVVRERGIRRALAHLEDVEYLVLNAYFRPLSPYLKAGLSSLGQLAGVILLSHEPAAIRKLVAKAAQKRSVAGTDAARAKLRAITLRANAALILSQNAYSQAVKSTKGVRSNAD